MAFNRLSSAGIFASVEFIIGGKRRGFGQPFYRLRRVLAELLDDVSASRQSLLGKMISETKAHVFTPRLRGKKASGRKILNYCLQCRACWKNEAVELDLNPVLADAHGGGWRTRELY